MTKKTVLFSFFIIVMLLFQCTPNTSNVLKSDNKVLVEIIKQQFGSQKIIPELIHFTDHRENIINRTSSTNHFPSGLVDQDSLSLHYDFFDLLLKEGQISKTEHELLDHMEYSLSDSPNSLPQNELKITTKDHFSLSPKGDKIKEFNQFSPILLFNKKAILYRYYHHQFGILPTVSDGTFYLFSKKDSKWELTYKWTAWIS